MEKVLKISLLKAIQQTLLPFGLCMLYVLPSPCTLTNAMTLQQELSAVSAGDTAGDTPSRRRMVQLFLVTTPERTARKHWSSGPHGRGLLPFPKCSNIEGLLLSEGHRYYCCRVISLSQAEIGVGSCLLFIYPSNSQVWGFF